MTSIHSTTHTQTHTHTHSLCVSPVLGFDGVWVLDLGSLVPVLWFVVIGVLNLGRGVDGGSHVIQEIAAVHHRLVDQDLETVIRVQHCRRTHRHA